MPIQGLRHTANFLAAQRPENFRETILLLYPSRPQLRNSPLTALTSLMKKRKVDDPKYHWFEKEMQSRRFVLTTDLGATAGGAADNFVVDPAVTPATTLKKNDVLRVEGTGEIAIVSADPSATNTIPVLRGMNTGGAGVAWILATAGNNPNVLVVGSAFEEGSDAPTGISFDPLERTNQTQIFRSNFEMTRTAMQTRLRTGDAVKEAKRECLEIIGIDMERAYFFSKLGTSTVGGKPRRMMSGLLEQITAAAPGNVLSQPGGGLDMNTLENWMNLIFAYGSGEKMVFGGNRALLTLNQVVRKNAQMHIEPGIDEYGMKVARIYGPFGTLVLVPHPLFSVVSGGVVGGTAYNGFESTVVVLDMAYLEYVYLQDLDYVPEQTLAGLDGKRSGYLAECSVGLGFPKAHFVINGLTSAIKDAA